MKTQLIASKSTVTIGFESEIRNGAAETPKIEVHEARLRLINARAQAAEIASAIRQAAEGPVPSRMCTPLEAHTDAVRRATRQVSEEIQEAQAAA